MRLSHERDKLVVIGTVYQRLWYIGMEGWLKKLPGHKVWEHQMSVLLLRSCELIEFRHFLSFFFFV